MVLVFGATVEAAQIAVNRRLGIGQNTALGAELVADTVVAVRIDGRKGQR